MQNHSRRPFRNRIMKEIDEDAIQGPRHEGKRPSARIWQRLSLVFGLAEATAAGSQVKDSAEFILSERRPWFKFEGNCETAGVQSGTEYKFAKELGCKKHMLYDASFAAGGRIIP